MSKKTIQIIEAAEHNLKNVSLSIPKEELVVLCGPSGSGKSSLAFDTLQMECQRQYMESMGLISEDYRRPKVKAIQGLSPSISIGQGLVNRNPRSTVGTMTDIAGLLRAVYASEGEGLDQWEQEILPGHFSFNTHYGCCPKCHGMGEIFQPRMEKLVNKDLTIEEGAVQGWDIHYIKRNMATLTATALHYGFKFPWNKKISEYDAMEEALLLHGTESKAFEEFYPGVTSPATASKGRFEGIATNLLRRFQERASDRKYREKMLPFFSVESCPECGGQRLGEIGRSVTWQGFTLHALSQLSLKALQPIIEKAISRTEESLVADSLNALSERVDRLILSGVGYLSLNRRSSTLSGGEEQRIRMAALLVSGLTGVLYVFDEPTTGLHPADGSKVLDSLRKLRDLGNTVLAIEHNLPFIKECDYLLDMGPEAGPKGGEICYQGSLKEMNHGISSPTAPYLLKGYPTIHHKTRSPKGELQIIGATTHNLKDVDAQIPLGVLCGFAGVSGSGKTSLVMGTIAPALDQQRVPTLQSLRGQDQIDQIIAVTQKPIGRSSRSNPATYCGIWTPIRELLAREPQAKKNRLKADSFSFNLKKGCCPECSGTGEVKMNLAFLPDSSITCPVCRGRRFLPKVLEVEYRGYAVDQILELTLQEALDLFIDQREIQSRLGRLIQVGLGYLTMGQSVSTLSGGEAQRLKLAAEMIQQKGRHCLYLLDEPSAGLHPKDVEHLIHLMQQLVDQGNSIFVIEHNPYILKNCDWILELGPQGGDQGGELLCQGTPLELAGLDESRIGSYLN